MNFSEIMSRSKTESGDASYSIEMIAMAVQVSHVENPSSAFGDAHGRSIDQKEHAAMSQVPETANEVL